MNPRAICNIGASEYYHYFRLGWDENPINIRDDAHVARMLELAKDYVAKRSIDRFFGKPAMPSAFERGEDGGIAGYKPDDVRRAESEQYSRDLAAWSASDSGRAYAEYERRLNDTIRFSVSRITDEDFTHPTRDVNLPTLPPALDAMIGGGGRPVLIKRNIFEKNLSAHPEITPEQSRDILGLALYHATLAGRTQPKRREHYWIAVRQGDGRNAAVVVDVYPGKGSVEVVGWRSINARGLERLRRQAEREDGKLLMLSPGNGSAADLSALAPGSPSSDGMIPQPTAGGKGESRHSARRVTPEEDRAYLDAVERGDMERASRMVREAAARAMPETCFVGEDGLPKVFYHNTNATFTIFDSGRNGTASDAGWLGDGFYFYGNKTEGDGYGRNKMSVFLDVRNPYFATEEENSRLAEANSRDESIAFRRQLEDDGHDGVFYNGDLREEAVVFSSAQVKSAETVTRDDAGRTIPLSERFDAANPDVRYSVSLGETSLAEKLEAFSRKIEEELAPAPHALNASSRESVPNRATGGKGDSRHSVGRDAERASIRDFIERGEASAVSGDEYAGVSARDLLGAVYADFGDARREVENPYVGKVVITRTGIRDSIHHGVGRAKIAAFKALPEIIASAHVVRLTPNWKGRGYDSRVLAAPVDIGGVRHAAFVVVNSTANGNRFYLHEVVPVERMKKEAEVIRAGSSDGASALSRNLGDIAMLAHSLFAVNGESSAGGSSAVSPTSDISAKSADAGDAARHSVRKYDPSRYGDYATALIASRVLAGKTVTTEDADRMVRALGLRNTTAADLISRAKS
ncbi:MAG: hypothetical protein ACI4RA_00280, partial [Kiritimatiellia bacterium]